MSLFSTIGGAVAGFASGGPLGALAGGIGGLLGNQNQQTTEQVLRELTPQQQAILDQAFATYGESLERMTPEAEAALRDTLYQAAYNPQAKAIRSSYAQTGGQQDATLARRGMLDSSTAQTVAGDRQARQAGDLADAASNATIQSEGMFSNRLNDQLKVGQAGLAGVRDITGFQQAAGSQTTTGANPFWGDVGGALGNAATNENSWWNKTGKAKAAGIFN